MSVGEPVKSFEDVEPGHQVQVGLSQQQGIVNRTRQRVDSSEEQTRATKTIPDLITALEDIFDTIEEKEAFFLNSSSYRRLFIRCEELKLNADRSYTHPLPLPSFFEPLSRDILRAHPVNIGEGGDEDTREDRVLQGKLQAM